MNIKKYMKLLEIIERIFVRNGTYFFHIVSGVNPWSIEELFHIFPGKFLRET